MTAVTIALLVATVLILSFVAHRIIKDSPDRAELARLRSKEEEAQHLTDTLQKKSGEIERLLTENAAVRAHWEDERKLGAERLKLLQDSEARLKTEFENLANRIFEDKGKVITEQNAGRISGLLQPFKEQLDSFRRRVDEVHKNDTERSARLLEQVRQLQELSNKVSDEANHLASAIKGDVKKQGDWGELVLEKIFEASGLECGREYEQQVALPAGNGSSKRPDFIVHLPGDKVVIVDSKVSLIAYERFFHADSEADRDTAAGDHVRSVRAHIRELQDKGYSQLLGNKTLDFVIMCIPLEPAYQLALQSDADLLYDLAQTNVVVTGPTTLMITLKLIAQIWRREKENRNAEKIADQAGRMHDQVVLVVEAMREAQKKLGGVSESFELALKRLAEGRGNLVKQADQIRQLGAKVSKRFPPGLLESSEEEELPEMAESGTAHT
jgi:DNA recombination protein RmuC